MSGRLFALVFAALVLLPGSALAWGGLGHRVVARLAYERLTPRARSEVDRLLAVAAADTTSACPVESVENGATWADCVRGQHLPTYDRLTPLHFEDRPLCGVAPKTSVCPGGRCVNDELKRALAVLRDRRRSDAERVIALGVQSRGEVGRIVSEAIRVVSPCSAGGFVWGEAA